MTDNNDDIIFWVSLKVKLQFLKCNSDLIKKSNNTPQTLCPFCRVEFQDVQKLMFLIIFFFIHIIVTMF